ncbi:unnamed protein product [Ectocarpus sp. 6 AP-2014]
MVHTAVQRTKRIIPAGHIWYIPSADSATIAVSNDPQELMSRLVPPPYPFSPPFTVHSAVFVRDGNNTDTLCRQLDATRTLVRRSNNFFTPACTASSHPFSSNKACHTKPLPISSSSFITHRHKNTNKGTHAPSAYAGVFLVNGIILNHSAVDLFDPLFFYLHRVTQLNAHPPPQHARNVLHATEPVPRPPCRAPAFAADREAWRVQRR